MNKARFVITLIVFLIVMTHSSCGGMNPPLKAEESPTYQNESPSTSSPPLVATEILQGSATSAPTDVTNQVRLAGEHLMLMKDFSPSIYFQEVHDGQIKKLSDGLELSQFLIWQDSGCSFLAMDWGNNIVKVSLEGTIVDTFFSHDDLDRLDPLVVVGYPLHLSPDQEWIWYFTGSGAYIGGRGPAIYETMNVHVLSTDGARGPFIISENGGAWFVGAEWSPDGSLIAYTDVDAQHAHQLFVSTKEGSHRRQITQLAQQVSFREDLSVYDISIRDFAWSPDSNKLVVNYVDEFNDLIAIYSLDGNRVVLSSFGQSSRALWWVDNQRIVIQTEPIGNGLESQAGIFVYNTEQDSIEAQVLESDFPSITQVHPFISLKQIGFFHFDQGQDTYLFSVLDLENHQITNLPAVTKIEDLTGWWVTPANFSGENQCP